MDLKGWLLRRLRAGRSDERGNVLVMFGFIMVPVIGLTGATIDYSRAISAHQVLNSALDSAALMAARDASKLSDSELRGRINNWIKSNLNGDSAEGFTTATTVIDRTARTIAIEAQLDIDTSLARMLGPEAMTIKSRAHSTWGTNTIELALVLDNTGSMASSGKMDALKTASKDLITIMQATAYEPDQIRISIVPFSTRVLLETSNKDASWLRYEHQRDVNCGYDRFGRYSCQKETITKSTWTGCVADRDRDYDVNDTAPTGNSTAYPAEFCDQYSPANQARILPLTSNWTALKNRVDAMTPVGATNVTIGASWGMAMLSPGAPFTEAKPSNTPRLMKIMILLTDGDNTRNRFEGNGSTPNSNVDKRTKLACTNAKAAGIAVYTIRVMDGNRDLLRECASATSMYYEVSSASQLSPVFQQIAREISQVRLTQ